MLSCLNPPMRVLQSRMYMRTIYLLFAPAILNGVWRQRGPGLFLSPAAVELVAQKQTR